MAAIVAPQFNGSTTIFAPQTNATPTYVPPDIAALRKHTVFTLMRNQPITATVSLL